MPDWREELQRRLAPLRLSPVREAEIVEELSQHLEDRFRELLSRGASADRARRSALDELSEQELAEALGGVEFPAPPPAPPPGVSGGDGWLAHFGKDLRHRYADSQGPRHPPERLGRLAARRRGGRDGGRAVLARRRPYRQAHPHQHRQRHAVAHHVPRGPQCPSYHADPRAENLGGVPSGGTGYFADPSETVEFPVGKRG